MAQNNIAIAMLSAASCGSVNHSFSVVPRALTFGYGSQPVNRYPKDDYLLSQTVESDG